MIPDEARPQSNERESTKPAPGLDSAQSSPAPVLPTDTAAPKAVPRTDEVSPTPAGAPHGLSSSSAQPAVEPSATDTPAESPSDTPAQAVSEVPASAPTVEGTTPVSDPAAPTDTLATSVTADTSQSGDVSADPHHDPHHDPYHDYHHDYHHDEYHQDYHSDEYHRSHDYHDSHSADSGGGTGGTGGGDVIPAGGEPDPLLGAAEEGGGPVKSFLEHLEDVRWVIVKCVVSIALAMVVCLLAVPHLVSVMTWPLQRAAQLEIAFLPTTSGRLVEVMAGDQRLWSFRWKSDDLAGLPLGTNKHVAFELGTMTVGTNQVLILKHRTDVPAARPLPVIFQSPMEPFFSSLKIAFFGGFLIACPYVVFVLLDFILPALHVKEKRYLLRAFWVSVGLFIAGVVLCYLWLMPLALKAAESYANWMGAEFLFWRAEDYFGFVCKFLLAMGLGFEMPVVLLALVKIGILDYNKLAAFRRYMIVVNFVLAAMLAPEVITQIIIFVPLQILYEVSVWVAWYWAQEDRVKARQRAVMVVGGFILAVELVWLLKQFGLPWLEAQSW